MARPKFVLPTLIRLVPLSALLLGLAAPPPAPRPMPDTVKEKLSRQAAGPRYDQPDLAWSHYREKRLGRGQVDAARLYAAARRQLVVGARGEKRGPSVAPAGSITAEALRDSRSLFPG